jgi:hypothetical protein
MGIKQAISAIDCVRAGSGSSAQISGYEVANAATHWTDGKKIFPILELLHY